MKYILIALTIVFLGAGTAAADITEYRGEWINRDTNTRDIARVVIEVNSGGKAYIHVWGKCSATDTGECDWGWKNCTSYADRHLSARFQSHVSVRNLTISFLCPDALRVKRHTRFVDGSGKLDYEGINIFRRLFKPIPMDRVSPRPMDRITPKPVDRTTPRPMDRVSPKLPAKQPTGKY